MNDQVKLRAGPLEAVFTPFGARLSGLWHADSRKSLVLGYNDPAAFANDPFYLGAVVGPIANRVSGAVANIGKTCWRMTANEGDTCLHSGPEGTSQKHWRILDQTQDEVVFGLRLAHADGGLPGNRDFRVTYRLSPSALALDITAISDRDTPVNFAHHPYWCLDHAENGPSHRLEVRAQQYLPVGARGLPAGDVVSVRGSLYDFTKPRGVPVDVPLDANLCVGSNRSAHPVRVARLSAHNGLAVTIDTTEPGLQVYNGAGLRDLGTGLHNGGVLRPYHGLALEPQGWPDALNNPTFPSILLKAGQSYHQQTVYGISKS